MTLNASQLCICIFPLEVNLSKKCLKLNMSRWSSIKPMAPTFSSMTGKGNLRRDGHESRSYYSICKKTQQADHQYGSLIISVKLDTTYIAKHLWLWIVAWLLHLSVYMTRDDWAVLSSAFMNSSTAILKTWSLNSHVHSNWTSMRIATAWLSSKWQAGPSWAWADGEHSTSPCETYQIKFLCTAMLPTCMARHL